MGKSAQDIYATALTILQVGQPTIQLPPNPDFNSLSPEEKDQIYQDLHNQVDSLVLQTKSFAYKALSWGDTGPALESGVNFGMNTFYGRYGAPYNMVALSCFNEELLLLPKNPTEAKLQAMSTQGESTEPTKGVMKHTYKAVLYNYCLMQYCCILFYQLVRREGCKPNQREKVSKSMDSSSIGNR
jgi:hypothetical protein